MRSRITRAVRLALPAIGLCACVAVQPEKNYPVDHPASPAAVLPARAAATSVLQGYWTPESGVEAEGEGGEHEAGHRH